MMIQDLIDQKLSGEPSFTYMYIQLAAQATGILIAGFILWRVNSMLNNKRIKNRSRNSYFETSYTKNWKR